MKKGTLMQEKTAEIYDIFSPVEGLNTVYYGKVRNGKTYNATADIIELLEKGEIVFANWHIDFKGFDERDSFIHVLLKTMFGKKYFYKFNADNFHYFDTADPELIAKLNKLVGVHIFVDEGQWIFNSHLKTDDPDKRRLILEGGHYCRSLNVITQRPMNVMKDIRSQINIWYKCSKKLQWGNFIMFQREEIQDMKDDVPDEDPEVRRPVKVYRAKKKVFQAYSTHAMRRSDAIQIPLSFDVYQTNIIDRLVMLFSFFIPASLRARFAHLAQPRELPREEKKGFKLSDLQ